MTRLPGRAAESSTHHRVARANGLVVVGCVGKGWLAAQVPAADAAVWRRARKLANRANIPLPSFPLPPPGAERQFTYAHQPNQCSTPLCALRREPCTSLPRRHAQAPLAWPVRRARGPPATHSASPSRTAPARWRPWEPPPMMQLASPGCSRS